MKILCIEDTSSNVFVIEQLALRFGYDLIIGTSGAEALTLAHQQPDLILMDIGLPDIDGLTVTRQIRQLLPTTPIIAVTAHALKGHKERCLAAGCTTYLSKPYKVMELLNLIQQFEPKP